VLNISITRTASLISRGAALLALFVLFLSCGSVASLRDDGLNNALRVPFVRVLIQEGKDQTELSTDDSYAIECLAQGKQDVYYSASPIVARVIRGKLEIRNERDEIIQANLDEVNIIPRGNNNRINVADKRYRGIVKVLPNGETVQIINLIYMEDYLRGVVPPELGLRSDDEIEAIKAQALAARTYAMSRLGQYGAEPYDLKASILDQVYNGAGIENALVNSAIDQTPGMVIVYHDALIDAYYHSTCGGMTDDIEDVWEKREQPYLKAVNDSAACSWSKYFSWKEYFTESQIRSRVEQYLSNDRGRDLRLGEVTDAIIGLRTAGGRIEKFSIRTDEDIYHFRKDRIRWVMGRTSNPDLILPSARFDIAIDRDAQSHFTGFSINGHGYGHGVGMCQCGAIGKARQGWTYEDILKLYYTGIDIKRLY